MRISVVLLTLSLFCLPRPVECKKHPIGSAWFEAVQRVYLPSVEEQKKEGATPNLTSPTPIQPVLVAAPPQSPKPTPSQPLPAKQPTEQETLQVLQQLQEILAMQDDDQDGWDEDGEEELTPEETAMWENFFTQLKQPSPDQIAQH